jgi:hypothetical protein
LKKEERTLSKGRESNRAETSTILTGVNRGEKRDRRAKVTTAAK